MKTLPLMLLVACGGYSPGPTYKTAWGTQVFLDYADPSHPNRMEADVMEAQLLSGMGRNGWPLIQMREALRGGVVRYTDEVFECVGTKDTEKCQGQLLNGGAEVVAHPGCEVNSAYRHELAHRLSWAITGSPDASHSDSTIWPIADSVLDCGGP